MSDTTDDNRFDVNDLKIDLKLKRVVYKGKNIFLSPPLLKMLACLRAAAPDLVERGKIFDSIWGHKSEGAGNTNFDKARKRLNKKLAPHGLVMKNEPRLGYQIACIRDEVPPPKKNRLLKAGTVRSDSQLPSQSSASKEEFHDAMQGGDQTGLVGDIATIAFARRVANGALYNPSEYQIRLDAMVTTETARSAPLCVAIGKGDWVGSWLPRLVNSLRDKGARPKISKLIILSLDPKLASSMESGGGLEKGFTQFMLGSIERLKNVFPGSTECRVWKGLPEFHGFLHGRVALVGEWARDAGGCIHVMTSLREVRRDCDPEKFARITNAFKLASPYP